MQKWGIFLGILFLLGQSHSMGTSEQAVGIKNNRLTVGDKNEPFLYGAELQYFRLRGGHGPNINADKVYALWDKALKQMKKAGMNALSFYIPWDFHEYKEGHFDFTGTADEDGDGQPDYPSRNVLHFINLAKQNGFNRIMVRPGPYINAEWGFLGFGAIPLWFHQKYPKSHMQNSDGYFTKLYDYHNPDFLASTRKWFQAVYDQVLKPNLGTDSPVVFLQLDNETNFMWQSIYNHDYGPGAITRYKKFLQNEYGSLENLNIHHRRQYQNWNEVKAPVTPAINTIEDRDWYQFNDRSMYEYLQKVRQMWQDIGIKEPQVLFTLAESYNAVENGILPNFKMRAEPDSTGLMTLNLYPKTYELGELLNFPFKADLDAKSMVQANKQYIGDQEWLLSPEVQTGWWRGIQVTPAARQQTYLTIIGHGVKALFVYYFSEGQNWGFDWSYNQVKPIFDQLREKLGLENVPVEQLPETFWSALKLQVDQQVIMGIDARKVMTQGPLVDADLYFDAPLDSEANPRPHFSLLENIGKKLVQPFGEFLAGSIELSDPVGLILDVNCHAPSRSGQKDNVIIESVWMGGLVGFLLQAGINPQILHTHLFSHDKWWEKKVLLRRDCGIPLTSQVQELKDYVEKGGLLINFGENTLSEWLNTQGAHSCVLQESLQLELNWSQCRLGKGTVVQVNKENFIQKNNSDHYGDVEQIKAYQHWISALHPQSWPHPLVQIVGGGDRTTAFGRVSPAQKGLWLTIKTGLKTEQKITIKISKEAMKQAQLINKTSNSSDNNMKSKEFVVHDVLQGQVSKFFSDKDGDVTILVTLPAVSSKALFVTEE